MTSGRLDSERRRRENRSSKVQAPQRFQIAPFGWNRTSDTRFRKPIRRSSHIWYLGVKARHTNGFNLLPFRILWAVSHCLADQMQTRSEQWMVYGPKGVVFWLENALLVASIRSCVRPFGQCV
jgi:hypothetical protein